MRFQNRCLPLTAGVILILTLACQPSRSAYELEEIARSDARWTGVAVSRAGRIFVNVPRWAPDIPYSVAELGTEGEPAPYPDADWNQWNPDIPPGDRFVCVQSVTVDDEDVLWVLDPASAWLGGVVPGGAKLVKIDLNTDAVVRTYRFDDSVAPTASYLNDVRIDTRSKTAYITDSGLGAVIVVDLDTGESRRLLAGHASTQAEDMPLTINGNELPLRIHSDGIALDGEEGYLYYQPLTGTRLYRIETEALRDRSLSDELLAGKVQIIGETGPSDGMLFLDGKIYLTSIERNAVRRISTTGRLETVVQDSLLQWPDSFARTADGDIVVTTSRIGFPPDGEPCRLFKIRLRR